MNPAGRENLRRQLQAATERPPVPVIYLLTASALFLMGLGTIGVPIYAMHLLVTAPSDADLAITLLILLAGAWMCTWYILRWAHSPQSGGRRHG